MLVDLGLKACLFYTGFGCLNNGFLREGLKL